MLDDMPWFSLRFGRYRVSRRGISASIGNMRAGARLPGLSQEGNGQASASPGAETTAPLDITTAAQQARVALPREDVNRIDALTDSQVDLALGQELNEWADRDLDGLSDFLATLPRGEQRRMMRLQEAAAGRSHESEAARLRAEDAAAARATAEADRRVDASERLYAEHERLQLEADELSERFEAFVVTDDASLNRYEELAQTLNEAQARAHKAFITWSDSTLPSEV
jgi:hypothetical protein